MDWRTGRGNRGCGGISGVKGAWRGEGGGDGADEGLAYIGRAAEADLSLCRVDIDVYLLWRKIDEEYRGGACFGTCAWAGLPDRVADDGGGGRAAVHERELVVAQERATVRALDVAVYGYGRALAAGRIGYGDEGFGEGRTEEIANAFLERCAGGEAVGLAAVERQGEADVGMGEGMDGKDGADVSFLGGECAEELAACGDVAEEIAHLHACAGRRTAVGNLGEGAGVDDEAGAGFVVRAARDEGEARDGGDGRDCLAPEAEGVDVFDVVDVADLRRGLPLEGEKRIVARHSAAVVAHGHEVTSAGDYSDVDARRAGVEGVLEQFLEDGRWPLDDLSGGDLVCHVERQQAYVSVSLHLAVQCE